MHAEELDRKARTLEAMRRSLLDLAERCHGDERPECPILDGLGRIGNDVAKKTRRSEEHTSELQSLMRISYAVFCLKKKTTQPYKYRPLYYESDRHADPLA